MAKIKLHMNFFHSLKFKGFREFISSRAFIGSLLFATALWIFTSLNEEYVTYVEVPFSVVAPEKMAVESRIAQQISVKVRGTGWQLFNLIFFNSSARCNIDLGKFPDMRQIYNISRNDILKSTEYLLNVEPIDVDPESMTLTIGRLSTKKVQVRPMIEIETRPGFKRVGHPIVVPDSIKITGSELTLSKLQYWPTQRISIGDLYKPESVLVNLSDSLANQLTLSRAKVKVNLDIQQSAEMTYHDIQVKVRGGTLPDKHKLTPGTISVTLRGGVHEIAEFSPEQIQAYIKYTDVIHDSTGVLIPVIEHPSDFNLVNFYPPNLRHRITENILAQSLR